MTGVLFGALSASPAFAQTVDGPAVSVLANTSAPLLVAYTSPLSPRLAVRVGAGVAWNTERVRPQGGQAYERKTTFASVAAAVLAQSPERLRTTLYGGPSLQVVNGSRASGGVMDASRHGTRLDTGLLAGVEVRGPYRLSVFAEALAGYHRGFSSHDVEGFEHTTRGWGVSAPALGVNVRL